MTDTVPRALLLDVGWTLLYPRRSMWEVFADVAHAAGAHLDAMEVERLIYELTRSLRDHALAQLDSGMPHPDSDAEFAAQFTAIGRLIFASAGVAQDSDLLTGRFLERFWNGDNWLVFPDVFESLDRLRGLGIRLGVLSNASSTMLDFLHHHRILGRLDFAVVSAVEGIKKPDRRIFEIALQRAGTNPAETAHVGDMYIEDIVGAGRVGIRSFFIDRGNRAMFPHHPETMDDLPGGTRIVRSLREVVAALEAV